MYCVIIGATGSGKTTQVPQILLDQAIENGTGASCNIVCTQPRRIAATSVAKRVADERAEKLQDTVGYQVRFDAKLPKPGGSIVYCTTGILLQQLQHSPDEVYDNVSHLVIDEVHERDIIIDFLLIMLKKTMAAHQPTNCPTLSVPGRTFPVTERYLENILQELKDEYDKRELCLLAQDKATDQYLQAEQTGMNERPVDADSSTQEFVIDWKKQASTVGDTDALVDNKDDALVPLGLAATTIAHIAKTTENGAILVFLPGLDEIVKLDQMLRVDKPLGVNFNDDQQFQVFMLHSSIPDSQKTVFDPLPDGCRKIILSTNIAETSVTIPDVQYVVDTGKSREKRYDQMRRITALQAGRVQNGNYYALFTRSRRESMRAIGLPELLRSDLQEICLDVKSQAFKMPVRDFLAGALEPPSAVAVDTAMRDLTMLGAITEEENLTPLGRLLASLPVHPSLGKMIVLGLIFRCLDPMIILGAAAHERPLFASPVEKRRTVDAVKSAFSRTSQSDHIMLLNAFSKAREISSLNSPSATYNFFNKYFIHRGAFNSIASTARQIEEILQQSGLIQPSRGFEKTGLRYGGDFLNENSDSEEVIKALLFAGMHPNIAMNRGSMYRTCGEKHTFIHQSSVNDVRTLGPRHHILTFTSLSLSADGGRMNLRDTTKGTPLMPLLLAGQLSQSGPMLELDGWLRFYVKVTTGSDGALTRHNARNAASEIAFFRQTLDLMLEAAFNNLKDKSFSNDVLREKLADGLASILSHEANQIVPAWDDQERNKMDQRWLSPSAQSPNRRGGPHMGSRTRLDDRTVSMKDFERQIQRQS
ncbi:P-loop containing nucleoside triphosphate hydrolase protein [Cryphonectria parasitica EP155]|uniref:RNA helicase n=1 Tax=Cryphonectria parasitica (strain ATCC 38755 / EP155) TaxID=660469 RepID=A0A9P4Y3J8_CRYP1|nr:P-loop containing nucleoside triphosphate hydrolase protein [Cryphonectria parasitica EP155]KAF3765480.1 P-loop containing nucleoside triphosphate hydrolase protein [Cryphonectria parasitica EP155]